MQQLISLLGELTSLQYNKPIEVLSGSSIGMHVRHIIEFYETFFMGLENGEVDYDLRERKHELETNSVFAGEIIRNYLSRLEEFDMEGDSEITVNFSKEDLKTKMKSSLRRELAYLVEHTIHHMAIIKVALKAEFPQVPVPDEFGVAYSTLQYRRNQCAR